MLRVRRSLTAMLLVLVLGMAGAWAGSPSVARATAADGWGRPVLMGRTVGGATVAVGPDGARLALMPGKAGLWAAWRPPGGVWGRRVLVHDGPTNDVQAVVTRGQRSVAVFEAGRHVYSLERSRRGVWGDAVKIGGPGPHSSGDWPIVHAGRRQVEALTITANGRGRVLAAWYGASWWEDVPRGVKLFAAMKPPGNTWLPPRMVSDKVGFPEQLQAVVDRSGRGVLAWPNEGFKWSSRPAGAQWTRPRELVGSHRADNLLLAVNGATSVTAVWTDRVKASDGRWRGKVKASRLTAGQWQHPATIFGDNRGLAGLAVTAGDTATVGIPFYAHHRFLLALASRSPDGRWSKARTLGALARWPNAHLVGNLDGKQALAWEKDGWIWSRTKNAGELWGPTTKLAKARIAAVALGERGDFVVGWYQHPANYWQFWLRTHL